MILSNSMTESLARFIFLNTVTASLPLADLGATAGTVTDLALSLHTGPIAVGDAQTVNEVSTSTWTTYARQTVTRNGTNWTFTSPNKIENAGTITFPTNGSGGTPTVVSWLGIGSNTGNRVIFRVPLSLEIPKAFVRLDAATNETVQVPAHGYSAGQEVMFFETEGSNLPTGISEGVVYYVRTTGLTSDAFSISTTGAGGSAVDLTDNGSLSTGGLVARVATKTVNANDSFKFDATNKITIQLR